MESNRKCLCTTSYCGKCLGGNCQDENCQVHSAEAKTKYRRNNPDRFKTNKPSKDLESVGLFVVQLPPDIVSDLKDKSLYITIWQDSSLMLFTEDQWQEQKKHLKQLIEEEPAKERAYTKLILNSARTLLLKENAVAIPDHMLHHVGETDNLSVTATPSGIQISSSRN